MYALYPEDTPIAVYRVRKYLIDIRGRFIFKNTRQAVFSLKILLGQSLIIFFRTDRLRDVNFLQN